MSLDVFSSLSSFLSSGINTAGAIYNNERNIATQKNLQDDSQSFNAEQSALDRSFQSQEADINRRFQAKEAELAFDREVDFYEKYKSPSAQVQQYKDAGLNPMLLAGGMGASSSPSASAPSGSMPSGAHGSSGIGSVSNANPFQFARDAFDFAGLATALEQRKADVEKTRAETENLKQSTSESSARTDMTRAELNWVDAINSGNLSLISAETKKLISSSKVDEKSIERITAEIANITTNTLFQADSLETAKAQRAKFHAEIQGILQGVSESMSRQGLMSRQVAELNEKIKLLSFDVELYGSGEVKDQRKWSFRIDNDNKEAQTALADAQELYQGLLSRGESIYGLSSTDPFMVGLNYLGAILATFGKIFSGNLNFNVK